MENTDDKVNLGIFGWRTSTYDASEEEFTTDDIKYTIPAKDSYKIIGSLHDRIDQQEVEIVELNRDVVELRALVMSLSQLAETLRKLYDAATMVSKPMYLQSNTEWHLIEGTTEKVQEEFKFFE